MAGFNASSSTGPTVTPQTNLLSLPAEVRQMILKEVMGVCSLRDAAIPKLPPLSAGSATDVCDTHVDEGEIVDIADDDIDEFKRARQLSQICGTLRNDMEFLEPRWLCEKRARFDVVQFESFVENASSEEWLKTDAVVLDLKLYDKSFLALNNLPGGIWKYFPHQAHCPDNCHDFGCLPRDLNGRTRALLRWWEVLVMKLPQRIKYVELDGLPDPTDVLEDSVWRADPYRDLYAGELYGLSLRLLRHNPKEMVIKQAGFHWISKNYRRHEYMPPWMSMEHERIQES